MVDFAFPQNVVVVHVVHLQQAVSAVKVLFFFFRAQSQQQTLPLPGMKIDKASLREVKELFIALPRQIELEDARRVGRVFGELGDQLVIFKESAIKTMGQEDTFAVLQLPQRAAAAL